MDALEAWLNKEWTINTERAFMKEFYYFPQLTGIVGYMRGKWLFATFFLMIFNVLLIAVGGVQFAIAAYVLLDKEFSIAAFLIHIVCGNVILGSTLVLMISRRSKIMDFLENLKFNEARYDDNYDGKIAETWKKDQTKTRNKIILGFGVIFVMMASQVIVFNDLFDKIQNKAPKDAYVGNVYVKMAIPCWFPFRLEEKYAKYFCWLYMVTVDSTMLSQLFTLLILIITVYGQVNIDIKILIHSIEQLEQRAIKSCFKKYQITFEPKIGTLRMYKDPTFIKEYELCLIQNIQHHQRIRRLQATLDSIQRWPMFFVTFNTSVAIACSFLTIMKGDTRISSFTLSFMLLIMELASMTILCDQGQQIIDLGDELLECFYKLPWIYLPHNTKKEIMIFQEVSKKYMAYRAGGMYRTDWEYFTAIMNAAYSSFNLLYAMQSD